MCNFKNLLASSNLDGNFMTRIEFIEEYSDSYHIEGTSIIPALIRCLDIEDAVRLLQSSLSGNLKLRNAALKIVVENSLESWTKIYDDLIEDIIKVFPQLPSNRRGSAFYCLGELGRNAPPQSREIILKFLLSSRYAGGRRKGLSIIDPNEIPIFENEIASCAFKYRESKAAFLMIQNFTPKYLYENREAILSILDAAWAMGRLYLRAAEYQPACINELREIDGITFAYAKVKLGQNLSIDDMKSLLEIYRHDERLGLLIWAVGKMKHWDVLAYVIDHYDTWQRERMSTRMGRGIA